MTINVRKLRSVLANRGADLPAIQGCRLPNLNSRNPSRRTVGTPGIRPDTPLIRRLCFMSSVFGLTCVVAVREAEVLVDLKQIRVYGSVLAILKPVQTLQRVQPKR